MIKSATKKVKKLVRFNISLMPIIKLIISLILLFWVFKKIPLAALGATLYKCHWTGIIFSIVMVNICMFVSALKWQPLLKVQQIKLPYAKVLSFYYVGLFANNFLPSSIGGDAMRIYDVARSTEKPKEAAASVIMERLLASMALALTAGLALMLASKIEGTSHIYWLVGGILTVCLGAFGVFLVYPFSENAIIGKWLCRLYKYKEYPAVLFKVLLLSFVFQALLVAANIFIFQALDSNIQLAKHFFYIPVIMAISMLPLSINGIGVREGMYVMLYGRAGVDPSTAVMCSLLFFMLVTITSLVGGIILAVRK